MTFVIRRLAMRMLVPGCLVLLLSMSACKPGVQVAVPDKAADEAAVRHVLDEIVRTFNEGDFDGMFALYRDDVVTIRPGVPDAVGKATWREGLAERSASMKRTMRFNTQEIEVGGDIAYERGTYVIEAKDAKTGAPLPAVERRHIHIFKREADGSWKGWRLMENTDK